MDIVPLLRNIFYPIQQNLPQIKGEAKDKKGSSDLYAFAFFASLIGYLNLIKNPFN
jgi:hypothetical protein